MVLDGNAGVGEGLMLVRDGDGVDVGQGHDDVRRFLGRFHVEALAQVRHGLVGDAHGDLGRRGTGHFILFLHVLENQDEEHRADDGDRRRRQGRRLFKGQGLFERFRQDERQALLDDFGEEGDARGNLPVHFFKGITAPDQTGHDAGQERGEAATEGREAAQGVAVQAADDARGHADPGSADDAAHEDADDARAGQGAVDARAVIGRNDGQQGTDDGEHDGRLQRQGCHDILTEALVTPQQVGYHGGNAHVAEEHEQ